MNTPPARSETRRSASMNPGWTGLGAESATLMTYAPASSGEHPMRGELRHGATPRNSYRPPGPLPRFFSESQRSFAACRIP